MTREDATFRYLEELHQLTSMSQQQIEALDLLTKIENYDGIPVETWHETFASLKLTMTLLQDQLKKMTEYNLQIEDTLTKLVAKHEKK